MATMTTLEILSDSLKGMILRPATQCEMEFDIGKIQAICAEAGTKLRMEQITDMIEKYCVLIQRNNPRVIGLETKRVSPKVLLAIFIVRLFDADNLPVVDEKFADKLVVSKGEWRKSSGARSKHK